MVAYIAYLRVSTHKQGRSGLGVGAQRELVRKFTENKGDVIQEFVEVESGKLNTRPELAKAIELAERTGAILLVATLDRLSRDVKFLFTLRDKMQEKGTKLKIEVASRPGIFKSTLEFGVIASMAQYERETIAERTKKALAVLREKGVKLGNHKGINLDAQRKASQLSKDTYYFETQKVQAGLVEGLLAKGSNKTDIIKELDRLQLKNANGRRFTTTSLATLIRKFKL